MVLVCLPSDALSQHLLSHLSFSYLGLGVSLHGCSSKVKPLLLTLDEGYPLTLPLLTLNGGVGPLLIFVLMVFKGPPLMGSEGGGRGDWDGEYMQIHG